MREEGESVVERSASLGHDEARREAATGAKPVPARPGTGDRLDAAAEWRHWLTGISLALLLLETLTGLAIWLLPFSVFNQFGVIWHTAIGVVMLVPLAWYLGRHWWLRFRTEFNHYQLPGYVAEALPVSLFVSGFVLTGQAAFGTASGYTWANLHLIGGPVIRLGLHGQEIVQPGERVDVQVVVTNSKTGHRFPTGPLDIIRSWVELTVTDEHGNVVHESGEPDAKGGMAEDAMVFKADGIDRYGNDIDQHNLWEMVGARFERALFPGMRDSETYSFSCPGFSAPAVRQRTEDSNQRAFSAPDAPGELRVRAVLNYQKADAAFLDRLFGADAGIRTPITELSDDDIVIRVDDNTSDRRSARNRPRC